WQWWATAPQADRPSTAGPRVLDHVCVLGYFLFLPHSHSTAPSHPPLSLAASNGGRQYRRPATPRPRVCAFLPTWHYLLPFHSPPTSPSRSALSLSIPCRCQWWVAVVSDSMADALLQDHVRRYLRSLLQSGLTARLFRLLRELNRPDAAGSGSPSLALVVAGAAPPAGASPVAGGGERGGGGGGEGVGEYVMDGRGLLARRADVVQRERLLVAQCVALSCLLCRLDPKEAKELFELLQDAARDWSAAAAAASSPSSTALALPPIPAPFSIPAAPSPAPTAASTATASAATAAVALHITYTLMFALLHALLSDSLASPSSAAASAAGGAGGPGGAAVPSAAAPASPSVSSALPAVLSPNEAFRKEFSRLVSVTDWAAAPSSAAPASPSPSAALPAVLAPNEAFLKESSIMVLKSTPSATASSSSHALVPFQSGPLSLPPQPSPSASTSSPPTSSPLTPPAPDDVISVIRLAWAVFLANTSTLPAFSAPSLSPSRTSARGSVAATALAAGGSGEDVVGDEVAVARECLKDETLLSATTLLLQQVLSSAVFENDDEDLTFTYMVYTHKLLSSFFLQPITRERIRELRHASLSLPFLPASSSSGRPAHADVDKAARLAGAYPHSMGRGVARSLEEEDEREQRQQQREEAEAQEQVAVRGRAYLGLLQLVGAVYARQPELMAGGGVLWQFVMYVGEEHRGAASLVAFLNLLAQLATGEEGSRQVHELMNGRHLRSVSWHALMQSLQAYDDRLRQAFQDPSLPYHQHHHHQQQHHSSLFPPEDAAVLEAYLMCLHQVLRHSPPPLRTRLFSDAFFDALFRLLPHAAVPPALKGALRSAIAAFLGAPATVAALTTSTAPAARATTAAAGFSGAMAAGAAAGAAGGGATAGDLMAVAAAAAGLTGAAAAALAARTWALEEFYDLPPSASATLEEQQARSTPTTAPCDVGMELNEGVSRVEEYPSVCCAYLCDANSMPCPTAAPPPSPRAAPRDSAIRHGHGAERGGGEGGGVPLPRRATAPYDMGMELSEVEARVEEYPSTLSYLRLHNTLLALDPLSRPVRFLDYFRFVTSSVFVPYTRRVYARADEMWQLLLASLSLFHLSLLLLHRSPLPSAPPLAALSAASSSSANGLLPAGATPGLLLMKDFLSAGPALRNIIAIITAGPDALLEERALRPQALSFALEDTVAACLRLLLLALSLDQSLADTWQPAVRPLHLVLADDVVLVTAVMSFVRYQPSDAIQRSAIELTSVFSARGVPLVAMALEVGMVQRLVEDFAECLDVSASTVSVQGVAAHGDASGATVDGGGEEEEGGEEGEETDCATLILQLLLASLGRQRPTLAHMLLGFDVDRPLAASLLQPNRRFSALRILLDLVLSTGADADSDQSDATAPPRVSLRLARLREMSVRVLYHLAADPATSAPTAVLLQAKPLSFFAPLLSSALSAPLPRRSSSPGHRVAALHERAWLLKLLALALHTTPPAPHAHKHHHSHHAAHSATAGRQLEICRQILSALFMADGGVGRAEEVGEGGNGALVVWGGGEQQAEGVRGGVLAATQLLELFLFALPDVTPSFLPHIAAVHHQLQLEELLGTAAGVAEGGVFEVNERGDRLVDLRALSHILTHRFALLEAQRGPGAPFLPGPNLGVAGSAAGSAEVRQEAVREALRFVWRRNRVEEEAAAQQHVALAWAQLLQMALSRRFDLLPPHARLEALLHECHVVSPAAMWCVTCCHVVSPAAMWCHLLPCGVTCCHVVSPAAMWCHLLPCGVTCCHVVSPAAMWCHLLPCGVTCCHVVSPAAMWCHLLPCGVTCCHVVSPAAMWCHLLPCGVTCCHVVSPAAMWCHLLPCGVTCCHVVSPAAMWCHLLPCGVTCCHVVSPAAMWCHLLPCGVTYCHVISPTAMSPTAMSPAAMSPAAMSPAAMSPTAITFPRVVLVAFLQLQHLSSSSSPTSIDTPSSDDAGEVTWSDVIGHSSLSDTSSREGLGGGASGAGGGGPRRQVSVAESTGLLRDLLGALMRKDSSDSLRRRLYTSLLTFLAICARRFRSADVDISPAVMAVILKELPGEETSSDRSLDMLERQRREMQRATHALLSPHLPTLIRTLSHDASSSPSPLTRSLALAALSSLLSHSADPIAASASLAPTNGIATAGRDHRSIFAQSVGGGQNQNLPIGFGRLPDLAPGMTSALAVASTSAAAVLSQMQAHGMVQACIADVSKGISEVLLLPSADAQRQAFVTEARLALLLAMAAATGRQGLLLLLNAGFLRAMAACPSLDAPVSEASYLAPPPVGLSSLDVPSESLCFAHLVAPVLRLLLALSTLAPPDASLSPHAPPSDATSKAGVASQLLHFLLRRLKSLISHSPLPPCGPCAVKADVASQLVRFAVHHDPMLSHPLCSSLLPLARSLPSSQSKADVASQLVQFAIHHEPMLSRLLEDRSPACNPTDLLLLSLSTAFLSRVRSLPCIQIKGYFTLLCPNPSQLKGLQGLMLQATAVGEGMGRSHSLMALLWADPSQLEGLRGLMLRAAAAYSVGDGESRVKYVRQRVAREEDDRAGEIGGISLSLLLPPLSFLYHSPPHLSFLYHSPPQLSFLYHSLPALSRDLPSSHPLKPPSSAHAWQEEQAMEEGVLRVRANLMAYLRSLVAFKRLLLPAASKHQVIRRAASKHQVIRRAASKHQVIRHAASKHQVIRHAASKHQVIRHAASKHQVFRPAAYRHQHQGPTLSLLSDLLRQMVIDLQAAVEARGTALTKVRRQALLILAGLASSKERALSWMLFICEHLLHLLLAHFSLHHSLLSRSSSPLASSLSPSPTTFSSRPRSLRVQGPRVSPSPGGADAMGFGGVADGGEDAGAAAEAAAAGMAGGHSREEFESVVGTTADLEAVAREVLPSVNRLVEVNEDRVGCSTDYMKRLALSLRSSLLRQFHL
ncbi:unnamed protein product, partial [Closterium sp. NIES-64]